MTQGAHSNSSVYGGSKHCCLDMGGTADLLLPTPCLADLVTTHNIPLI